MEGQSIILKVFHLLLFFLFLACDSKRPTKRDYTQLPDSTSLGKAFYIDECARCHGNYGEGNKEKKVKKLKGAGYTFDELKFAMFYPEGNMPEFDDLPDSLITEIHSYIKTL